MTMSYPTIRKEGDQALRKRPNLSDYEGTLAAFHWEDVDKELDGLPGGGLNLGYEAIDRHLQRGHGDKIAMLWEGRNGEQQSYTFAQMKEQTDKFANVLRNLGVKKGDRVFAFLDRVPPLYFAVFGALKLGAIIGPLFSAFGPDPVKDRLLDSGAKVFITSPELKRKIAGVLRELPALETIIMVGEGDYPTDDFHGRYVSYHQVMAQASSDFAIERTTKDDFSIMHYTSGTTGKPKGAVHVHGSVYAQYLTGKYVLDLQPDDIYWCTADPGWVTGTSYGMIAPWTNGITQVVYEGGFGASAWYNVIQKYRVTVWYTAPTAIRMLMKAGDAIPKRYDLSSLRYTMSVGEPLNPEAVVWGQKVIGLPFHDNWWQTETGAIMIANYPAMDIKPGSMGRPVPGISAAIVDDDGKELPSGQEGNLVLRPGWPSMFRTYWGNNELYDSCFRNDWYYSKDRARRDEEGYFWFVGRADDVINTAGHLVGPFEVESALIEHPAVAEAGVIGKPDPIAMEVVKAFVALKDGYQPTEKLRQEIFRFARQKLAAAVAPREIEFLPSLPKTRSGKIMRRLLKARELGLPEGDTSTLED